MCGWVSITVTRASCGPSWFCNRSANVNPVCPPPMIRMRGCSGMPYLPCSAAGAPRVDVPFRMPAQVFLLQFERAGGVLPQCVRGAMQERRVARVVQLPQLAEQFILVKRVTGDSRARAHVVLQR